MVIVRSVGRVLATVEFDDQARLQTRKVGDIAANRDLPSKPIAADLLTSKTVPEVAFGIS